MFKYSINIVLATIAGAFVGIISFYWALYHLPALAHIKVGGWYTTSPALAIQQSPYELARRTIAKKFSIETNEDIILQTKFDETGKRLNSQCIYELQGPFPSARLFTLYTLGQNNLPLISNVIATYNKNGKIPIAALFPFELSSNNILTPYNNDYKIYISAANHPLAGNWLAAPTRGKFTLLLALYNSPYLRSRDAEKIKLPPIHLISCNKIL